MIKQEWLKSNGSFGLIKEPYAKKQHPNQQEGLDQYVDVVDFCTGQINSVKLYENTKGLHFKKNGSHYLDGFDSKVLYVPFQIIKPELLEGK